MLTRYWGCTCLVTSHKISLSLASMDCPQSTDGYMKFNLLFASSDEHCSWQEGEISVDMRRYYIFRLTEREDRKLKTSVGKSDWMPSSRGSPARRSSCLVGRNQQPRIRFAVLFRKPRKTNSDFVCRSMRTP